MERDGDWFKGKLEEIFGYGGQSRLARFLRIVGDQRAPETALRTIQNYAAGRVRISGEMVVLMEVLTSPPARVRLAIKQAIGE